VKIANLDVVSEDSSLMDALQSMQDSGHTAVVIRRTTGFGVVAAADILSNLRLEKGSRTMREIGLGRRHTLLTALDKNRGLLSTPEAELALTAALRSSESPHALLEVDGDRATVATVDKVLESTFNVRLILCRCEKHPNSHVWQPGELRKPGLCNLDDAKVTCR
jgi:CBS domain-containing protein